MKEGWEYKKLEEVCEKLTDGSHNPPKGISYSEYKMISSQNVYNNLICLEDVRYLSQVDFLKEDKRTKVQSGDVLLTIVGTVGRCAVVTGEEGSITLQRSVAVMTPKSNLSSRFLMYICIGNKTNLNQEAHGIAQKGIYLTQLKNLSIPIPPLSEQQHIVEELDLLSSIIEKKKAQLKELDNLSQSIFYEMFSSINDHVPISNYIESVGGGKSLAGNEECENKVLKTGAVTYDHFNGAEVKNLPIDYIPQQEHLLKDGDILVSRMNTLEYVGACAYVWKAPKNTYLPDRLWRVKPKENINSIYLWFSLIQSESKEQIRAIASGTSGTMKNISRPRFLSVKIKNSPLDLQNLFASKIQSIEHQKALIKQSITEVETLFNSRMDYYFN